MKEDFVRLARQYQSEVVPVGYRGNPDEARRRLNSWAMKATDGLIREIVNWKLHTETHFLFFFFIRDRSTSVILFMRRLRSALNREQ